MTHHQSSIRNYFLALLLVSSGPAFSGTEAPAAARRLPAAPSFLAPEVERELATAPVDGHALEIIYRRSVRSDEDAASFFQSAAFLRLGLGCQRRVIDAALALDPAGFLGRTEFLPMALRADYRAKSRLAAGDLPPVQANASGAGFGAAIPAQDAP